MSKLPRLVIIDKYFIPHCSQCDAKPMWAIGSVDAPDDGSLRECQNCGYVHRFGLGKVNVENIASDAILAKRERIRALVLVMIPNRAIEGIVQAAVSIDVQIESIK
jgi:Zn ribbon nucleic-acid-binding protein